jgi:hypothetical protein
MSVHLSIILEENGQTPNTLIEGREADMGVACVRAGDARNLVLPDGTPRPQGIMPAPTDKEPSHAVVFDLLGLPRSDKVIERLVQCAEWVIR